jgi:lipopolysaccharide assembly outer membrane protein LptD (OstA)
MTRFSRTGSAGLLLVLVLSPAAAAQIPGFTNSASWKSERISENHWRLTGAVEVSRDDMTFFADQVDFYTDTNRLVAVGNVVFQQIDHRIAAERADFNTRTSLGTFFNAFGIARLGPQANMAMFGSLEPDVYFYGETLEKIAPDRYRITHGGFTTCVQPTPRWQMTSGSIVLRLDHYALLKNPLLKVKSVPVLYMPVVYYPINKSDRATGFLMPQYGRSTLRGRTFSNAFFMALGRSHDATINHDYYSKTGQGLGGEYRYVMDRGSFGNLRTYYLKEHEATYETGGVEQVVPARKSYQASGSASQRLNPHLTARGRADYFSNIVVQQTYYANVASASSNQRIISAALTGSWGVNTFNSSFDRTEYFSGYANSTLTGGTPRLTFSRAERPIPGTPLYASLATDYSHILREYRLSTGTTKAGLDRLDIFPRVRFPFTRWPFFTIASSLAWRDTYWSDSTDESGTVRLDDPISRQYFDMQVQFNGPIFQRVWNTPGNGYAERFKHAVQPFLNIQRTTAIDQLSRIVQLDSVDSVIGDMTRYIYGMNNRFYAKRAEGGGPATAREIGSVSLQQSYYTDPRAAAVDALYRTSFTGAAYAHFSAVSLLVRGAPTREIGATFRTEYDTKYHAFKTLGADGSVSRGSWFRGTVGWSQKRFIEELPGFNDRRYLDHYISGSTDFRLAQNRYGFVHSFNYNILQHKLLQQRIAGYYNAQCCGFVAEYQMRDFTGSLSPVPKDRRFSVSFTLAGIGTFSNPFGNMSGVTR